MQLKAVAYRGQDLVRAQMRFKK